VEKHFLKVVDSKRVHFHPGSLLSSWNVGHGVTVATFFAGMTETILVSPVDQSIWLNVDQEREAGFV